MQSITIIFTVLMKFQNVLFREKQIVQILGKTTMSLHRATYQLKCNDAIIFYSTYEAYKIRTIVHWIKYNYTDVIVFHIETVKVSQQPSCMTLINLKTWRPSFYGELCGKNETDEGRVSIRGLKELKERQEEEERVGQAP